MKYRLVLSLTVTVLVGWTGIGVAQQGTGEGVLPQNKVRQGVWQKVQEKGVAQVNVRLNGQWELDSKLSREAALTQRKAIAAAQKALLAELSGTRCKVLRRSQVTPSISLEVGPDALQVLESSALVKDVYLEMELKLNLLQSVPLIEGHLA